MTDLDRLKRSLRAVVRWLLRRVDLTALYPATVVQQYGDGSLDLLASVPGRPNLTRVPIQYGVPGFAMTVKNGGEVLVGFTGADRKLPYVLVYDQATVESVSILGGTKPVARLGDGCQIQLPATALFSGTVNGSPFEGPVAMANPFPGVLNSGQLGAQA